MDYLIVDAQYYLRRNFSIVKLNEGFNKQSLIDSFLWTLMKIHKNYPARKVILLWDKRPYLKSKVIENYKGDRYEAYTRQVELETEIGALRKKFDKSNEDLDRIKSIEVELQQVNKDVDEFKIFGEAKYELMAEYIKFGFPSIQIKGFEADDLARLIALVSDKYRFDTYLVSGDSDWTCFPTNYTKVVRWKSQTNELYSINNAPIPDEFRGLLSPYEYYQLNDIYNGGHNNVILEFDRSKFSLIQIAQFLKNNIWPEELLKLKDYYEALDIDKYLPYIEDYLVSALRTLGVINSDLFDLYHDKVNCTVYKNYMKSRIRDLDEFLYKSKFLIVPKFEECSECGVPLILNKAINSKGLCKYCEQNHDDSKNTEAIPESEDGNIH